QQASSTTHRLARADIRMSATAHATLRAVATVLVAHAIAYMLLGILPRVGAATFGIGAADPAVLERFTATTGAVQSYPKALAGLLQWDFGKTLDGISVRSVIYAGLVWSFPIFSVSLIWTINCSTVALFWPHVLARSGLQWAIAFVSFVPAFVPGF